MAISWRVGPKDVKNRGGFEGRIQGGQNQPPVTTVVYADNEEEARIQGAAILGLTPGQIEVEWLGNPV